MKHNIFLAATAVAVLMASCNNGQKWELNGTINGAPDTNLLVQASDNGRWYTLDSIKTDGKGNFDYRHDRAQYPDIYRITLGDKSIYFPVDSTETITVSSSADGFDKDYTVTGSTSADMLMAVDNRIRQVAREKGVNAVATDSLLKRELGGMIIGDPAGIVSYYIINKQVNGTPLYNPVNRTDNRIIGAVANAYNEFRPDDPRTKYLKGLYLANRPVYQSAGNDTLTATEIKYFDIDLMDNTGKSHKLSDAVKANKVVVLSFTAYQADGSPAYKVALAEAYNKYHNQGMEIYQVSLDNDEFQWKQSARNLPWITVYNPSTAGATMLRNYNVVTIPTTFIIANGTLTKRITDPTKIEAEVASSL